ncbi:MAG: DUF3800 domain-containing protein [Opitutales bacterium]|nr:DUF3800 domain-containing protein [Opitutales bacterium]
MYFFYIDESGTRDPGLEGKRKDGSSFAKDHLYVLTAISLFERRWKAFDHEIAAHKQQLLRRLRRDLGLELTLGDCEVKSTSLRLKKSPHEKGYSQFVHNLTDPGKTALSNVYYSQIEKHHMRVFAVVIDKRKLHDHVTAETLHKKAYELLLERIEQFLHEFHSNHNGLIVMDDTQKQLNHAIAMKHAFFQREGNANLRFKHIVEYPFFTDSSLSSGIQLADLCAYNIYRAFRAEDFSYPYFKGLLPFIYRSQRTSPEKLDGLKVFPDDSALVGFSRDGCRHHLELTALKKPVDSDGLHKN